MKFDPTVPPRKFKVGLDGGIELSECAKLSLQPDELVTLVDDKGSEYDIARKDWGYYATPSINGRLVRNGYKTALVRNSGGQYFIMLVMESSLAEFHAYRDREQQELVAWLDELKEDTLK